MIGDVPPDFWKIYWLCWFFIGFGAMEFIAIKYYGAEATLSYTVWWGLGTGEDVRDWLRWTLRVGFVVGVIWAVQHLLTGQNLFRKWFG